MGEMRAVIESSVHDAAVGPVVNAPARSDVVKFSDVPTSCELPMLLTSFTPARAFETNNDKKTKPPMTGIMMWTDLRSMAFLPGGCPTGSIGQKRIRQKRIR